MAEGWQWDDCRDVEPPGGPDHRAADAADLLTLKALRGFLPPEVFRQVAGLNGAMIAQRHAGDDDMVAFLRKSMKVLMRDGMSGSGSARTAVVIPPSPYVGGFAFNASAVDSVRGSAEDAASAVVLKEAPVPSLLERSAISPTVDLSRDERTEFSLIDCGALASGISGPLSEEAAVSVAGERDSVKEAPVPSVGRLERTEFSPRVEQEQEREQGYEQKYEQKQEQERVCAQSIGMASDIAVDRLDAISSVGDASREAVVVLKIGWCPDLGGRAVVSVRQAVGAGFGCLAGGMPVIRADAAGLVQEATLRVADEHVPVKEAPMVVVDATLSMVVKISERCEAVPACMESMGLRVEVIGMMLSPAVSGTVVDRYIALAVLASMAVEVVVPGSDPPLLSYLIDSGFDPPMQSCC